jgi:cytochrome c oxidase subunit IV
MSHNHSASEHDNYSHAVPLRVLLGVFAMLLLMTGLTVAATWFNLGSWNLIIAMGIATFKAALVALFFMHLRYDNPFNAIVFIAAIVFMALFIGLTLLDTFQYQPDIQTWQQAQQP